MNFKFPTYLVVRPSSILCPKAFIIIAISNRTNLAYNNPWPYIREKQHADEASDRARYLEEELRKCNDELEKLRKENALLKERLREH